ncbi:DUF3179 domain-containing (seleno)protein [Robertkochia aurantiaca]|uniref:DUF3179 domain-containing (seleno)protein n=1 Tax=Robertkochia aurantiaca TaxID=2873700 RepID=UPI001CCC97C5|nr:DUF3179 domain-containing (seleno)protein [Robertkochia sp. 3YJGBD-33]
MRYPILIPVLFVFLWACKDTQLPSPKETEFDPGPIQIFAQSRPGGPVFDYAMPVDRGLEDLNLTEVEKSDLDDSELVLGLLQNSEPVAIPINMLTGFEIANLQLDRQPVVITWCPLAGSARAFSAEIDGETTLFDFGRGLIYNNLLFVDRNSGSVWNQLSCKAVKGEKTGTSLQPLPGIQATWKFWRSKYPGTKVLTNLNRSQISGQKTRNQKQFYTTWIPGKTIPTRTTSHEADHLGLGINLNEKAIFFPLDSLFEHTTPVEIRIDTTLIRIFSDKEGITAWAEDKNGNLLPATLAYNWAWDNFYPDTAVYKGELED